MSLEYFIAKRLFFHTENHKQVSRPAVRIAVIGIAVGLAVMLVSVAVVIGFKHQVEQNVIGLSSHIQITSYRSNYSYEMVPMDIPDSLPAVLAAIPNVRHVQRFSTKPGIIKTGNEVQTVVFKGVAEDFDWHFLSERLVEGVLPDYTASSASNQVLISEDMATRLHLKVGDNFISYFIKEEQISARKWQIVGFFNTHFSEYDKTFVLADERQIARLSGWTAGQTGGIELFVKDIRKLQETDYAVYDKLFQMGNLESNAYYTQSVYDLNPDMFGWLDLLDMNVWLILILMIFVSGFNMISGLLILILERTNLIGMLKAMGADNVSLRKIFIYLSLFLTGRGLIWGNLIGIGVCALQYFFRIIPLDPAVYYVDAVPIEFNWLYIILLNIGTVLASLLMILLPSALVSKIDPVKAIRFD